VLQLISVISCCESNQWKRLQGRPEPYLLFGCAREPWILNSYQCDSVHSAFIFVILVRRDFLRSCRKCNIYFFRPRIGIVVVVFHPVRFHPSSCLATIVLFSVRRTPDINDNRDSRALLRESSRRNSRCRDVILTSIERYSHYRNVETISYGQQ